MEAIDPDLFLEELTQKNAGNSKASYQAPQW